MYWTTSYPLPIRQSSTGTQKTWPLAVKMGNEFWVFCQTVFMDPFEFVNELFIFYTETCTMKKIGIKDETLEFTGLGMFAANDDENMYIWKTWVGTDAMVLCKLEVTTEVLSPVLTVSGKGLDQYTPIVGNTIYALFHDEDEEKLTLKTINLTTNELIRETFLMSTEYELFDYRLLVNDGRIYLLEYDNEIGVKIYKLEDELRLLSSHMFDDTVGDIEICSWKDGVDYTFRSKDTGINYCYEYNFDTLKWEKQIFGELPTEFTDVQNMKSEQFDGMTYSIVLRPLSSQSQFDVRVFEYEPKLSTICYLNIVNELMKTEDLVELERIVQLLPTELSLHLTNMMEWRLEEKDDEYRRKLKNKQRKKVMIELTEMMDDGTVDEELFDKYEKIFALDKNGKNEEEDESDEESEEEEEEEQNDDE